MMKYFQRWNCILGSGEQKGFSDKICDWFLRPGYSWLLISYLFPLITFPVSVSNSWGAEFKSVPKGPVAPILETQVIVRPKGKPSPHSFEFLVSQVGQAFLTIVNGAQVSDIGKRRVTAVKIVLNGVTLVSPQVLKNQGNPVQVWRVPLLQGTNRLQVELAGKPNSRISARIDAPADHIVLEPIANAGVEGEPLRAVATVTGLGVPVPDAHVRFTVVGTDVEQTSTTDSSGTAAAFLEDVTAEATTLQATVVGTSPTLLAKAPIAVLSNRGLLLTQRPEILRLVSGESDLLEYQLDIRAVEGVHDQISL